MAEPCREQRAAGLPDRFVHDVGDEVIAEGRALSVQGELINSEVKIFASDGRIVAQGSSVYRVIDRG